MKDVMIASIGVEHNFRHSYFARDGQMIKNIYWSNYNDSDGYSNHPIGCYQAAKDIVSDTYGECKYASTLISCWRAVIKSKEEK